MMVSVDRLATAFWWVTCAALAVAARLLSPGILEGGDGVQHYQIAHYAWKHPELFLHHWGKPLFTLFASPFAQLGLWGMSLFNALCFVATCWAADGILTRAGRAARWLFPPALLLVPVYGTMVLAGMTEIFFAMLAILVVRALLDERYRVAMTVVSFMPFARPEYIAFAPFAIAWVLWKQQWRALPFVLIGHAAYAFAGGEVFGDLLWVFHQDPYSGAENIYGRGPLLHFVEHGSNIFGAPLLWTLGLALVAGPILWIRSRDDRPMILRIGVLALLPSVAILVVHSVLWWKGLKGSLGLVRVMATCAPLVVLCALWPIGRMAGMMLRGRWIPAVLAVLAALVYLPTATLAFLQERPLPVVPGSADALLKAVGDRVTKIKHQHPRVTYFDPQIAFYSDLDPYDTRMVRQHHGHEIQDTAIGLAPNDLLVWDSHFGPNEGGVPIERLMTDPELELLELMVATERLVVLGDHPYEVYLFARRKASRTVERHTILAPETGLTLELPHRFDTIPCTDRAGEFCFAGNEYPMEIMSLPLETTDLLYADLTVRGTLLWNADKAGVADLVFSEESPSGQVGYWPERLGAGDFVLRLRIPRRDAWVRNKLYIWNHSGKPFRLKDLSIEVEHTLRKQ